MDIFANNFKGITTDSPDIPNILTVPHVHESVRHFMVPFWFFRWLKNRKDE